MADYIHGYDAEEQVRLVAQAEYWRDLLILREVDFTQGESVLELGCGVGAVLGILGQTYPSLKLAGIDLQPTQIDYARQYLSTLDLTSVDLQVGDASQLPWPDESFDQVCTTWFLEHVPRPEPVLKEALRVLKPGGKLSLTEPDYMSITTWPDSSDYCYLRAGLCDLLTQAGGHPAMGRQLGPLLESVGFSDVQNSAWGYHFFQTDANADLKEFVTYVDGWLAPTVAQIAEMLGRDIQKLEAGLNFFRQIPSQPDGAVTVTIFRSLGYK
ncbi:MAG: class I SAM-dependent methyltransferase [Thermosynechococcaceae cyanobacterium]